MGTRLVTDVLPRGWGLCTPICTMHVQVLPRMRCAHVVLYVEKCDKVCEVNGEENMTYMKGW